jgi:hypothetical protein
MDPKELLSNPDTIKGLISALQSILENTEQTDTPKQETKIKKTKKIKTKKQPVSTNKFLQMQEMFMCKEDTAIDKKLSKNPPIPRTRHFDTVSVKCRVCGKTENVNPALVYDKNRYKCNNCSSTQG